MIMVVTAKEMERMRNTRPSDEELHYRAHMEELESAVHALVAGEDFEFTFDLTSWDKQYLGMRVRSILGRDFVLDFH